MPEVFTASYNPVTGERREFRQEVAPPPPPDYGMSSINPAAVEYLYRTQKIEDAEKAVSAAVQFQGLRGYQQALEKGEPAEKALARYGPMMFYSKPQAFGPSVKALTPPQINPNQAALLEFRKQQAAKPRPPIYRATPGGGTAKIGPDDAVTQIIPGAPKPPPDPVKDFEKTNLGNEIKALQTAAARAFTPSQRALLNQEIEAKKQQMIQLLTPTATNAPAETLSEQAQAFQPATKQLDKATATDILKRAGGDRDKARKMAKELGYSF